MHDCLLPCRVIACLAHAPTPSSSHARTSACAHTCLCPLAFPGLEELTLRPCGFAFLHSLPTGLSKLTALRALTLRILDMHPDEAVDHDALSPLGALCHLTALERLTLHGRLPGLPPCTSALKRLTYLVLSDTAEEGTLNGGDPAAVSFLCWQRVGCGGGGELPPSPTCLVLADVQH